MCDQYIGSYRNAIAMNNIAISMIDNRCVQQGLDTFHDAYQLLKNLVTVRSLRNTSSSISKNNDSIASQSTYHHKALLRLAKPIRCRKVSPVEYETVTPLLNDPLFLKLDTPKKLYFVRMEDMSYVSATSSDKSDLKVECSIILNNLALSYVILSSITSRQFEKQKYLACSTKCTRLACSLHWQVMDNSKIRIESNPEPYRLLGLILSNTEIVFKCCGIKSSECKQIFGPRLQHLRNKIQRIEVFFLECAHGIIEHTAAMA
jgi:hypothetical protein